ncbi:MAG: diaminopimelate decarboxylase, partial [Burkholderiales bacterium]
LAAIFDRIDRWRGARQYRILFEFGRSIVGNAGALLTRLEYLKTNGGRHYAVVDAAMNDLLRPTLYRAYHAIRPVRAHDAPAHRYDVVGPVCESGDWLGRERMLAIEPGDLLAVMSCGAYAMAMASNYNTRPRGAEVMVDGDRVHLVRAREGIADLFAGEKRLP